MKRAIKGWFIDNSPVIKADISRDGKIILAKGKEDIITQD
jgi:hypothetical protein